MAEGEPREPAEQERPTSTRVFHADEREAKGVNRVCLVGHRIVSLSIVLRSRL